MPHLLEVEVDWLYVQLLRNHHPPHDGIDEQREENVAEEYEDTHHCPDDCLLCGAQHSPIAPQQHPVQTHPLGVSLYVYVRLLFHAM